MSYLEEFVNYISFFPAEVIRSLELMRELDDKAQSTMEEVHGSTSNYFSSLKKEANSTLESTDLLQKIRSKHQEAVNFSDEKICISKQMIDMLENQIQKINLELISFKKDLRPEYELGDLREDPQKRRKLDKSVPTQNNYYEDEFQLYLDNGEDTLQSPDMKETDKKYCYCQGDSFGEMIGCDNPSCKREWFHFTCVGLNAKPVGTWYCPDCAPDMIN